MTQKPSIGRIVIFTSAHTTGGTDRWPAIITEVVEINGVEVCNLTMMPPSQDPDPAGLFSFGPPNTPGTWSWPERV